MIASGPVRRLLSLALSVLGLLFGLELCARLLHHPVPVRRVYDPFAWRIPQPGLVEAFTTWEGERVEVRLNDLGMRGPETHAPQAPGTLTLVFLGGSTTENYALNDTDTFPEQVGQGVARALGRPVRVFNAGQSAAVSGTNLARLQHQVLDLRPALVVAMEGINDLLGGFHTGFRMDGRHLPRPPTADARPRSYLLSFLRGRRWPWDRQVPLRPRSELERRDYADFPARRAFARNLRSMAAIAQAHGVPLLFVVQPSAYHDPPEPEDARRFFMRDTLVAAGMPAPDLPAMFAGMRAFGDDVRALPQGAFVRVFDLEARLPKTPELFVDECHFTKAGNRRVSAELLEPALALLRERLEAGPPPGR